MREFDAYALNFIFLFQLFFCTVQVRGQLRGDIRAAAGKHCYCTELSLQQRQRLYICIYMYMYMCVYIYICIYMYVCMYVCMYHTYVCMYVYNIYIYKLLSIYKLYMYVCMYVYILRRGRAAASTPTRVDALNMRTFFYFFLKCRFFF